MIDTREGFEEYLNEFNSGDYIEFVHKYFLDDAVFEKTGYTLKGADNIIDHFKNTVSSVIKETITLINYMEKDGLVSAELKIELKAMEDGFYIRERKKGEIEIEYCADFYNIKDNKIAHARIYRRSVNEDTLDLKKIYSK